MYNVRQKTAPFHVCNSYQNIINYDNLAHIYFKKFPVTRVFHILYIIRAETGNQLKFEKYSGTVHCAHRHRAALSRDAGLQL